MDVCEKVVEAKSLGPDGNSCDSKTRGLLQRAHIIANWPPIYIGKESDRHWEEGDDLSLLDFKAVQYARKGNAIANDDQLEQITNIPKRELMRRGVNQHTLEKICKQISGQANKFAKCLRVLEDATRRKSKRVERTITNTFTGKPNKPGTTSELLVIRPQTAEAPTVLSTNS